MGAHEPLNISYSYINITHVNKPSYIGISSNNETVMPEFIHKKLEIYYGMKAIKYNCNCKAWYLNELDLLS
jgi:hypothetical protein